MGSGLFYDGIWRGGLCMVGKGRVGRRWDGDYLNVIFMNGEFTLFYFYFHSSPLGRLFLSMVGFGGILGLGWPDVVWCGEGLGSGRGRGGGNGVCLLLLLWFFLLSPYPPDIFRYQRSSFRLGREMKWKEEGEVLSEEIYLLA